MSAPLVSVVLPTFNRASHLRRSVGSVLAQSFADFELLVVDDGSTDDTQAVVAAFGDARIRYLRRERNGGAAAARNTGVRAAAGRYLAFQDSDDEWLLDKLARQLEALGAAGDPESMILCGLLRLAGARTRRYPARPPANPPSLTAGEVLRSPFAYTQSWLVPRAAVADAGGFDESLQVWDDWELLIRLSTRLRIRVIDAALVISPRSADGISGQTGRFIHDLALIRARHAADRSVRPDVLAQFSYIEARLRAAAGQLGPARAAAWQALRDQPSHWRAGALLALSLGGSAGLARALGEAPPARRPAS